MSVQIAPRLARRLRLRVARRGLSRPKICTSTRFLDGFHAQDDGDPAAASVWQPLGLLVWLRVYQANKLAWSGAFSHEDCAFMLPGGDSNRIVAFALNV